MTRIIETTSPDGAAIPLMSLEEYVKARLNIGENLYMACIMEICKCLPPAGQKAIAEEISSAGPAMQQLEAHFAAHGVHSDTNRLLVYKD